MTPNDPLYFPRARHAEHLINLLADGIVNTLTLFAPRRMGKTQFLLNDIRPAAEAQHIDVFYFSSWIPTAIRSCASSKACSNSPITVAPAAS